ncbi:MAG: hypothetical protein Q9185_006996 [Variospora sp. 1 TL-2023]
MTETIVDSSLSRAELALTRLAEDPDRLDLARRRFSASPPSFTSSKGPDSTLTNSPDAEVGPHVSGVTQKDILENQRGLSRPRPQFDAQQFAERARLLELDNRGALLAPIDYAHHSYEVVKRRWQEQGIWCDEWNCKTGYYNFGHTWMHEEPVPPDSGFDAIAEGEDEHACDLFGVHRPPKRRGSELTPGQQETKERNREKSRPIHQFLWQLARERDRISGEPTVREVAASADLDINTKAYESVKKWWLACHIWDTKWGILPGMTWKHERPLEWPPKDDPETGSEVVYPNLVSGNGAEADPISPKSIHSSPGPPSKLMAWCNGPMPTIMPQSGWRDESGHSCQWNRDSLCDESVAEEDPASRAGVNGAAGQSTSHDSPRPSRDLFAHLVPNTQLTTNGNVIEEDPPEDVGMGEMIADSQPHPPSQSIGNLSVERPQKRPRGRPKKTPNGVVAKIKPDVSPGRISVSRTSRPHTKSTRGRGRPKKKMENGASSDKAALSVPEQATIPTSRRSKRTR